MITGWFTFGLTVSAAWASSLPAYFADQEPPRVALLSGLQPDFRERITAFIEDARASGVTLRADETFRTYLRQAWLHEQYQAGKGAVAAPPGQSRHETGRAADLWPMGVSYTDPRAASILDGLKPIAAKHGLKNLSDISDHDHWEDA